MNVIILLVAIIYAAGFVLIAVGVRNAISEEDLLGESPQPKPLSVFRDGFVQVEQDSGDRTPRRELCVAESLS